MNSRLAAPYFLLSGLLTTAALLSGCTLQYTTQRTPSAKLPGQYSVLTGLPYKVAQRPNLQFLFNDYAGRRDNLVLRLAWYCRADSADRPYFRREAAGPKRAKRLLYPWGVILPLGAGFALDEVETPNMEWQHFLNALAADSGEAAVQRYLPATAAQPTPDYFTDPFYRFYPVVGVSRAQIEGYCRWRSVVASAWANRYLDAHYPDQAPHQVRYTFRLPTEQEWEYAAGSLTPQSPYGTACPERRVKVVPLAASYLKRRAAAPVDEARLKQDIKAFNATKPLITLINCQRELPYFLRSATPEYVWGTLALRGTYHLLGNVAELVQEPGITKGGSYRDPLAACTISGRGSYTGPAPTVGFRCACDASFPLYQ
jgi:hypothetical protein